MVWQDDEAQTMLYFLEFQTLSIICTEIYLINTRDSKPLTEGSSNSQGTTLRTDFYYKMLLESPSPAVTQVPGKSHKEKSGTWNKTKQTQNCGLWPLWTLSHDKLCSFILGFFLNKTYSSQLILLPIPYFLINSYKLRMVFAYKVAISTFITAEFRHRSVNTLLGLNLKDLSSDFKTSVKSFKNENKQTNKKQEKRLVLWLQR